jgi:hypothetical protein
MTLVGQAYLALILNLKTLMVQLYLIISMIIVMHMLLVVKVHTQHKVVQVIALPLKGRMQEYHQYSIG